MVAVRSFDGPPPEQVPAVGPVKKVKRQRAKTASKTAKPRPEATLAAAMARAKANQVEPKVEPPKPPLEPERPPEVVKSPDEVTIVLGNQQHRQKSLRSMFTSHKGG